VAAAEGSVSPSSLRSFCRERLAAFKVPGRVVHMPGGLPKTSTGKVQKVELRRAARLLADDAAGGVTNSSRRGS
jgi:fatty-acyl-CoA synthase